MIRMRRERVVAQALCGDVVALVQSGTVPTAKTQEHLFAAATGLRAELGDGAAWLGKQDYGELAASAWAGTKTRVAAAQVWLKTESGPWLARTKKSLLYHASHASDYASAGSKCALFFHPLLPPSSLPPLPPGGSWRRRLWRGPPPSTTPASPPRAPRPTTQITSTPAPPPPRPPRRRSPPRPPNAPPTPLAPTTTPNVHYEHGFFK